MKKMTFSTLFTLVLILSIAILAEAGTARFPVEVKWNASGHGQVCTDIYLVNLKGTPVTASLTLYKNDGTKIELCSDVYHHHSSQRYSPYLAVRMLCDCNGGPLRF